MYVAVCRTGCPRRTRIISSTQSTSTEVLRQSFDNNGTAMHGMPASKILSIAFSSTFKQATPRIASTYPPRMIFITTGEPSATITRYPNRSAVVRKSAMPQAPQGPQSKPNSLYSAGHPSAGRKQCGNSNNRRSVATAATCSRQNSDAKATIVHPT